MDGRILDREVQDVAGGFEIGHSFLEGVVHVLSGWWSTARGFSVLGFFGLTLSAR